uniref:Uncharacterized protein n=1 Tax=Anopheles albimanus TaxID=7167 RepID=A0A182FX17_ANOAL
MSALVAVVAARIVRREAAVTGNVTTSYSDPFGPRIALQADVAEKLLDGRDVQQICFKEV